MSDNDAAIELAPSEPRLLELQEEGGKGAKAQEQLVDEKKQNPLCPLLLRKANTELDTSPTTLRAEIISGD